MDFVLGKNIIPIYALLIVLGGFATSVLSASLGSTAARGKEVLHRRAETIVYRDYTITYFDTPLNPVVEVSVNGVAALAATSPANMVVVLCTDSPIYYGKCMTVSLARDGCVDLPAGSPWDNTISSIEIKTITALCRIWRGHACVGDGLQTTYLNEGDTSRTKIKLRDWNDDISSIACYWDPRGVTGTWQV